MNSAALLIMRLQPSVHFQALSILGTFRANGEAFGYPADRVMKFLDDLRRDGARSSVWSLQPRSLCVMP